MLDKKPNPVEKSGMRPMPSPAPLKKTATERLNKRINRPAPPPTRKR